MSKKLFVLLAGFLAVAMMLSACGSTAAPAPEAASEAPAEAATSAPAEAAPEEAAPADFAGEELSILVSQGWMDNRYDPTIARFEEAFGVTVDLQTIPADQYQDVLQSRLNTDSAPDVYWIQSNPFAIESVIGDPTQYCLDMTGEAWQSVMPESRWASCMVGDKLYGLQLWHNSPEYVMVYNKSMFDEMSLTIPTTYAELLALAETLSAAGITPWFLPGADGWQHQLAFFQVGGVYEAATPGLYDALNNNTQTFAGNELMMTVLAQFKEFSDKGYFGEDWIGTDSTNMANEYADRNIAMAMANSSYIKQIQADTGSTDEFGMFLIPLGDNDTFPTNPAGPTMFGSATSTHPELVKEFFRFVTTTESLQEILDNSPDDTNIDVTDTGVQQHWLPEEEAFMSTVDPTKMGVPVLQTGTKYTNDYWMQFGADLVAYCTGQMDAATVLSNMDKNRAETAALVGDPGWA